MIPDKIRYSKKFIGIQNLFSYSESEAMTQLMMDMISRVYRTKGDYWEFGLFEGTTFINAYKFAQSRGLTDMKFLGWDSFEGLPEISGKDVGGPYKRGQYNCSLGRFRLILKRRGVDMRKVELSQGWFSKESFDLSKPMFKKFKKKAAIVWIDCDLYESTVPVLDFITDFVQDGTFLVFDDWFSFRGDPNKGEQKAFREWIKKNPQIHAQEFRRFAGGTSFILTRRDL